MAQCLSGGNAIDDLVWALNDERDPATRKALAASLVKALEKADEGWIQVTVQNLITPATPRSERKTTAF